MLSFVRGRVREREGEKGEREREEGGGERGDKSEEREMRERGVAEYTPIYLHIHQILPYTSKYLQIPSYNFIYHHVPPNIQY